ncbi:MAG: tetratricopeptide repeat protein [Ignavibacteriaceae bacterium]
MLKFIFIIVVFTSISFTQNQSFDHRVNDGIRQIYNIKFDDAEKTFRALIADYPDHPSGRFFLAMIDWWRILLDLENEEIDDIFFQKLEDVIYQCDGILKKDRTNVDALFFKGGAIGFRGRLRALRESWLKAADDGREALPIVEHAANLDPDNVDVQLGFGIYNYYADVIPNEFPLIKPLMIFFPSGDKKKGIEQLRNTAFNGKYAKYEAQYFLMTLYYRYENNYSSAGEFAGILLKEFPDNPVFQRWLGRISVRRNNWLLADSLFKDVIIKAEKNLTGYNAPSSLRESYYYVGYHQRENGNLDSAKTMFEKCRDISLLVDKNEESGFQVNSVLYLAMIEEAQGRNENAIELFNKVLKMRDYGNAHSIAKTSLNTLKRGG